MHESNLVEETITSVSEYRIDYRQFQCHYNSITRAMPISIWISKNVVMIDWLIDWFNITWNPKVTGKKQSVSASIPIWNSDQESVRAVNSSRSAALPMWLVKKNHRRPPILTSFFHVVEGGHVYWIETVEKEIIMNHFFRSKKFNWANKKLNQKWN